MEVKELSNQSAEAQAVNAAAQTEPKPNQGGEPDSPLLSPPEHPKPPVFRRPAVLITLLFVILGGLLFGGRAAIHAFTHETTDDAFVEGHIIAVSPRVSGHVVKLLVQDNQAVKKGDLLLEIDPKDYEVQVLQAEAALATAHAKHKAAQETVALTGATGKAVLEQASSGVSTAQAQSDVSRARLEQVKAQIEAAQANLAQAQAGIVAAEAEVMRTSADAHRYQNLFNHQDISSQKLEQAKAAFQTATANLEAAKKKRQAAEAQVSQALEEQRAAGSVVNQTQSLISEARGRLTQANTAPQQLAVSRANAASTEAEIKRAEADLERARLNLSYTKIYASETGLVAKRTVEEGNFVSAGQTLLSLVPNEVWVVANFKETQLKKMQPGQEVEIEVDALGRSFHGKVDSIQAGTGGKFALLPPDNATGNFTKVVQRVPVKIVLDPASVKGNARQIVPGMSTIVSVKIN
ncbi:MAG: HlyD family secretion protein [Blastocatellia bacterium]|nr:HlyD family secretion protein [Blastocatellia bacterium]